MTWDGVLVDAMPFHYEAMKTAVKEITNIDLDKRMFYLLEEYLLKKWL